MSIANKLSTTTDAELKTLHANTDRPNHSGTPAQQSAAVALIPSIIAELSARSEAASTRKAEALATKRAAKSKPGTTSAG